MTESFISLRAENLDPIKLERVLAQYLAYEQLRLFRSLLIPRLAVLVGIGWGLTVAVHLLPPVALIALGGVSLVIAAAVICAELHARLRLARELDGARSHQ